MYVQIRVSIEARSGITKFRNMIGFVASFTTGLGVPCLHRVRK